MSRKYRQRGYRDGEVDADREHERPGAPTSREGPRGRGLGAPKASSFKCARCGSLVSQPVAFDATCARCAADLHTCTNCRHFDSSAPNECREAVEERIVAKAVKNECKMFEPRVVRGFEKDSASSTDDARSAFESLFE